MTGQDTIHVRIGSHRAPLHKQNKQNKQKSVSQANSPSQAPTIVRVARIRSHTNRRQRHGRVDREIRVGRLDSSLDQIHTKHRDHRPVVCAQLDLRDTNLHPATLSFFKQLGSQLGVRRKTTADDQRLRPILFAAVHRLAGQHARHGIRQRRTHVIHRDGSSFGLLLLDPPGDSGFHTGEAEIVRMLPSGLTLRQPLGHADGMRIALLRVPVDMRATRIRESQQARNLVEALLRRIIERGANDINMPRDILDMQQ